MKFINNMDSTAKNKSRPCFSLREHLIRQGCSPLGVAKHMSFIEKTLSANPSLDLRRYRVNPEQPDRLHHG